MDALNKTISVIEPVNEAIERTKTILFAPFNLEKWFIIGFCAWLANITGGGFGGGNFHGPGKNGPPISSGVTEFCQTHIALIIFAAAGVFSIIAVIMLVLLWLSSRGNFMFLDCLAKNKAHIVEPWKTFKKQANGLLGFRLLLAVTTMLWIIALVMLTVCLVSFAKFSNASGAVIVITICAMAPLFIIVLLFFGVIGVLTFDFVIPIMYLQRTGISASWAKFGHLLRQNFWKIVLYLLFKMVIVMCLAAIVMCAFVIGCCLCCISVVFLIPYIGTVIFLPLCSFYRLYSLCYLRQFGAEYDVFAAAL